MLVRDRHGVEGFLTCEQVFVYSAEISNGCIVGYPFLKRYGLQLDASRDCLVDTLAEYSEPTVLREVGTGPNLLSLLIEEAPGGETPYTYTYIHIHIYVYNGRHGLPPLRRRWPL